MNPCWRTATTSLLLAAALALLPAAAEAIQPTIITGVVYNAYTGGVIPNATVTTTTGLEFKTQNGVFLLRVPPNVYDLIVSSPGYRSNMAAGVFSGPGQTAAINIWLAPASTVRGYLRGRVVSTSGQGLARAVISTDLGAITISDENGFFTAEGPSGTAVVTVAAAGYMSRVIKNVAIPAYGTRSVYVRLFKEISGPRGTISGTVRDACTGQPLSDISIAASNGAFVKTGDGTYSITAGPGNTTLLAYADGYQGAWETVTLGFFAFGGTANFSLVSLARGIGAFEGLVTDAVTGDPLYGARIETDTTDISLSGPDGTYTLKLSPCASELTATLKGYQPYTRAISPVAGTTVRLNIALTPLTTCIVTGTIRDVLTGRPVEGAQVTAAGGGMAETDDTGAYSLVLPDCDATVTICADGYFRRRRQVSIRGDAEIITFDAYLLPCILCRCEPAAATELRHPQ